MNIQNIQIAESLFRKIEEKFNSRKENISLQNDAALQQIKTPDAQDKVVDNPKVSSDQNPLTVVYPPFFPIGNTQDVLSIKKVDLTSEEMKRGISFVTTKEQKANLRKESGTKGTKAEVNVSPQYGINENSDQSVKNNIKRLTHAANPGDVLDLKI